MSSTVDIKQISADLDKLGSELSPSEVHGTLCGVLCGNSELNIHDWLTLTFLSDNSAASHEVTSRGLLLEAIAESFKDFFLETVRALADNNLSFYPLIPEDASESLRLKSIAEWAQGFLMGLSLAGIKKFSDHPAEVSEFVEAMAAIATVEEYELAGDDSDEQAIVEFIEFIRIGVLLVNEEINPMRKSVELSDSDSDITVH